MQGPGHTNSLEEGAGTGTGCWLLGIFKLKLYEAEARTLLCFIYFLMHLFFWLWLLWLNLNVGGSCGCGCSPGERSCLIMPWNFYFYNQVHGNFHGLKPQTLPHKWHHGNVSTELNLLKSGLRVTAAGALALGAGVRPPTAPAQNAFCQYAASLCLLSPTPWMPNNAVDRAAAWR